MVRVLRVAVGHYWQSVRMLMKLLFLTNAVNIHCAETAHMQRQSVPYLNSLSGNPEGSLQRFEGGGIDNHFFVRLLPAWI